MLASKRLLIYLLVAFECFCGRLSQSNLPTRRPMITIFEAFLNEGKRSGIRHFPATIFSWGVLATL
jgi:hypothetical protein